MIFMTDLKMRSEFERKKFLVVVDMQGDFIDMALGTKEAEAIVPEVVKKIGEFDGKIFVTMDTHYENYMQTSEGKNLPVPHCIKGTEGWKLDKRVENAVNGKDFAVIEKNTFGSVDLPKKIKEDAGEESFTIEITGLCTDICVVSNALLLKAHFPEVLMKVDSKCCAGVTPELHNAALATMRSCQIVIE